MLDCAVFSDHVREELAERRKYHAASGDYPKLSD